MLDNCYITDWRCVLDECNHLHLSPVCHLIIHLFLNSTYNTYKYQSFFTDEGLQVEMCILLSYY